MDVKIIYNFGPEQEYFQLMLHSHESFYSQCVKNLQIAIYCVSFTFSALSYFLAPPVLSACRKFQFPFSYPKPGALQAKREVLTNNSITGGIHISWVKLTKWLIPKHIFLFLQNSLWLGERAVEMTFWPVKLSSCLCRHIHTHTLN